MKTYDIAHLKRKINSYNITQPHAAEHMLVNFTESDLNRLVDAYVS